MSTTTLNHLGTASGPSRLFTFIRHRSPIVLCALVGFLSAFTVLLVGLVPVGELLMLAIFPWVLIRAWLQRGWPVRLQQLTWSRILFIALLLMGLGYIGSDLYRGTATDNFLRGWARVGFLGIDLVVVTFLISSSWTRFYVFYLALNLGSVVNAFVSDQPIDDWWKFGVGYPITALCLFLVAGRNTFVQIVTSLVLGTISLALGSRNLGGVCLLAGGLYWWRYARGALRPLAMFLSLGALVAMFIAANDVLLSNQRHEGSNVERQSMIETAGEAFLSSPLIGQGSWFTASHLMQRLEDRIASKDPTFHGYTEDQARGITIHSQLLISLAEGGILGGAFFLCFGLLLFKILGTLLTNPMPHRLFLFYVVLLGLWNLGMSPFSGVARVEIILTVAACLLAILQRRDELSDDYAE